MASGRSYGKLVDVGAGVLAIGAGLYLLQAQSVTVGDGGGQSWLELLAHGIGVYFIARGIWMIRHAGRQEDVVDRLDRIAWLIDNADDE